MAAGGQTLNTAASPWSSAKATAANKIQETRQGERERKRERGRKRETRRKEARGKVWKEVWWGRKKKVYTACTYCPAKQQSGPLL